MISSHWIARAGPWGLYALARWLTRRHPRILMYHRFDDVSADGVSAEILDTQVRHIARHFKPMTLGQLLEHFHAGERPPRNTLVVTVDDGHRDFFEVAWPILHRHGVPATLFVTTGFVDGELWLWPDQVAWLLTQCDELPGTIELGGASLDLGDHPWQTIIDHILGLPDDKRLVAPSRLAQQLGCELPAIPPKGYQPVSWDELRRLEANGIEIGGHTHTHPNLARVSTDRLSEEIRRCRERLDSELATRARPFCYPNGQRGDVTPAVAKAVADAGFTGAVVAYADETEHRDLYHLRRHGSSANLFQFYKASSGLEWLGRRWRKREAL